MTSPALTPFVTGPSPRQRGVSYDERSGVNGDTLLLRKHERTGRVRVSDVAVRPVAPPSNRSRFDSGLRSLFNGLVAQLAVHPTRNGEVAGSKPAGASINGCRASNSFPGLLARALAGRQPPFTALLSKRDKLVSEWLQ